MKEHELELFGGFRWKSTLSLIVMVRKWQLLLKGNDSIGDTHILH